jgi:hypothetical protein
VAKKTIKKWQGDGAFCQWLLKKEYAYYNDKQKFSLYVGDGLTIYMWEAWCGGKKEGEENGS